VVDVGQLQGYKEIMMYTMSYETCMKNSSAGSINKHCTPMTFAECLQTLFYYIDKGFTIEHLIMKKVY
jgi:hypothetical protein